MVTIGKSRTSYDDGSSDYLLSGYLVPGSGVSTSYPVALNRGNNTMRQLHYYPNFTYGEAEAHRVAVTYPRSYA